MAPKNATYAARAEKHENPLARQLLELMERKQTNLAVSIDVVKSEELLRIADEAGPYICIVKVGEKPFTAKVLAKMIVADYGLFFSRHTLTLWKTLQRTLPTG